MIIEEAGKFASEKLDSINVVGDKEGIRLENGVVRMPQPFIDTYKDFINTGWFSIIGEKKYGGQNLPFSSVVAINEIWQSTNMSFATNNMLTQGAIELLESHGTEEQKKIYLPNLKQSIKQHLVIYKLLSKHFKKVMKTKNGICPVT